MCDMQEMPRYKCHKVVHAFKIEAIDRLDDEEWDGVSERYSPGWVRIRGEGNIVYQGPDYVEKHNPHVGGYYVRYEDGYESFSPADAFESGYTLIG